MEERGHCKSTELYFCLWKGKGKQQFGAGFCVQHRIIKILQRIEFVSDRISYIVMGGL